MKDHIPPSALHKLAQIAGLDADYVDIWGRVHDVEDENLILILKALGFDASTGEAAEAELNALQKSASRSVIRTVTLLPEKGGQTLNLQRAPEGRPTLRIDGAATRTGRFDHERAALTLAENLQPGVYEGKIEADLFLETIEDAFTVIVSPDKGYTPEPIERGERLWGINIPLYAIRSGRNWGIGDFADLKGAVIFAAGLGADALGLLPLHAVSNDYPSGISPYYPWSRLMLNPIYIAVEEADHGGSPEVRQFIENPEIQDRIRILRDAPLVDYEGVWSLKLKALEIAFRSFSSDSAEGASFDVWKAERGRALQCFATFCALREKLGSEGKEAGNWAAWPEEYRRPESHAVTRFAAENAERIEFHAWLQWQAEKQLALSAAECVARGMAVGLYLDLALGVDPGGPDAWMFQDVLALDASAGCPPDPFSLLGQEWGLPPVKPEAHRRTGYRFGGHTLEANMRHAGALRIDHAAMLARLFWIPRGRAPKDGAYVRYPLEEQLALLRAVSAAHRCMIIGEDLGTIPQELKDGLARSGFFSYKLLLFEREPGGLFKAPFNIPPNSLVSFATHDLPTMDGWWTGRDLAVKRELGRYPDGEAAEKEEEERLEDRKRLVGALVWQELLEPGFTLPEGMEIDQETLDSLSIAVHAYIARADSRFMLANIDDMIGGKEMHNLPGTMQEHPNWRRKLEVALEGWSSSMRAVEIAKTLVRERGASPRGLK